MLAVWTPRHGVEDGSLPLYDEEVARDLATRIAAALPLTATPSGACLWCKRTEPPIIGFYLSVRTLADADDPIDAAAESMGRWMLS